MDSNTNYDAYNEECYSNKELKCYDKEPATYECHNLGELFSLFNPVRGTDYNNRIGRGSIIRSIYIRGSIKIGPFSTANPPVNKVYIPNSLNRLIIFIDWQGKGQSFNVNDVLQNVDAEAHLNINNRKRFSVIRDEQWTFSAALLYNPSNEFQMERTIYPVKIYERVEIPVFYTFAVTSNE